MTQRPGVAVWRGALAAFVLAGATGLGFRLAAFWGWGGLDPENIRHAHSHLMFFSWATPALMVLMQRHLPPSRPMRWATAASLGLGFVAYGPFLRYGYGVADVGTLRLPLSVIASTANIVAWYGFAYGYARATRGLVRTEALRLWDAAVGILVVATLGAWALGGLQAQGVASPFALAAALHLFLNLFAEGWLVLALLGVFYAQTPSAARGGASWATAWVAWALPFTFLLGVPVALVPPWLRSVSGVAGLAVSVGLLAHTAALWRGGSARGPLVYLACRSVMLVGVALAPVARWGEAAGLRIVFLHMLLLGWISTGLVAAARSAWGETAVPGHRAFALGVALQVASLFTITGLWPDRWAGRWAWAAVAATAALPVGAAAWMAVRSIAAKASEPEG